MLLIQELSVHICVIYAILDKLISCNEVPILVMTPTWVIIMVLWPWNNFVSRSSQFHHTLGNKSRSHQ